VSSPLYLDHNATTPLLSEVLDAMQPYLTTHFGNPSSAHAYGREAKAAVERARESVAALVGASASEVIFTSGGTEATALALRGALHLPVDDAHVITTTVEHPATARLIDGLAREGVKVTRLGVDEGGLISTDALTLALNASTRWFSVIHAHNETGVLQALPAISAVTKRHQVLLHVDASQSAGKVRLSMADDGFDLLTLAAHKLYGPKGVGALIVRTGVKLQSQQLGAGQERGLRAGTENVASIIGFGAACAAALRDLAESSARLLSLREQLITSLRAGVPGLIVAGEQSARLPNTVYALFPGVSGATLLEKTPGLAASTGSACHDGQESPAQVLLEMKVPAERALGAVRLSLGRHTMPDHLDVAAAQLIESWRALV
jgi:cysteine desulfurase